MAREKNTSPHRSKGDQPFLVQPDLNKHRSTQTLDDPFLATLDFYCPDHGDGEN